MRAAQSLIDDHVRKMVVESCQMLSVAYTLSELAEPDVPRTQKGHPRKHFNPNHPCCRWVVASKANWYWLLRHAQAIAAEYRLRFNKHHFCEGFIRWCSKNPPLLLNIGLTPPHLAMNKEFRQKDFVQAYRDYYRTEKRTDKNGKDIYKWTKRTKPQWA